MRTRTPPLPSRPAGRAALLCLASLVFIACGSRSLADRAEEYRALSDAPASATSAAPAAPGSDAPEAPKVAAIQGQADASVFEGCAGRRVDPANEFIGCKAFMASVHRPVGYTAEAALDTMIQDVQHAGYGKAGARTVTQSPYAFALDDRVLPGRRYTVARAVGAPDHHVAVVLAAPSGKLLIGHCQANGQLGQAESVIDEQCPKALATILTGLVPANIYLAKAPYADGTLVGRAVKTPDGCQREADMQRIRCGEGGQLSWYQAKTSLVPLAVVARAKTEAITASAQAPQVSVSDADAVKCTVEGVETTCVHHRLDIEGEPSVHFYQAKVEVRDDTLYAICSGAGAAPDKAVPAPCDQVFKW